MRNTVVGYLFIAPILIGIVVFQLYPIAIATGASFTNWNGLTSPQFVGFANYVKLLTNDPIFVRATVTTLLFMLGAIPGTMILALVLAALLSGKRRGMTVFRLAFFVPYIANSVAVSIVWFALFSDHNGVINDSLARLGINGPDWLVTTPWALIAVIIVSVWQGAGYPMMVLIAGIQAIPADMYEAASLDGASKWRQFWRITLPLLTPSLFFVSISQFIASFQVFGIVFVMTKGGPANATNVYMLQLFNTAFGAGQVGYASAMAWLLFIVIGIITVVQWRLQRRWVFYG